MNHLSEQDLVLYFYRDLPNAAEVENHLGECSACASEFAQLQATLSAIEYPVPERAPEYEAQLWSTLRPRLENTASPKRSFWTALWQPRRWAIAGALAAVIIAAFLAGRITGPKPLGPSLATTQPPKIASDRVLMVAVGEHLDRTQMILVELVNARAEGKVDISAEREVAQSLVNDNRLYRQTAQHDKDPEIAGILDQVERVLIDIAHQPDSISGTELEQLQHRIESQGVLFKVRVIESKTKARVRSETAKPGNQSQDSKL